jgi:TM2 domain-containing membrane protein YozV
MKCAVHAEADATGYCRNCGKAMCPVCARPVQDVLYCENCLAASMGHSATGAGPLPPSTSQPQRAGNPGVAFILGFLFPGLGAVYNGEYNKALIHIVVFATLIFGLASNMDDGMKAVLGIMLAGFIFYMAFDSMRTAQAQQRGQVSIDPLQSWSKNRPIGPIILIVAGAIFLLDNFDLFPFYRVERFWPLVLIAIGALMLRNKLSGNDGRSV